MADARRGRKTSKATFANDIPKVGQIKPQTPSGKVKRWQPPTKGTTPADRRKGAK